jgi:flagellar hook-length control protein FliK
MLNLTALTPPILPAVAGGSALPVAAPPPANAGRGFQDELQRAQHHRVSTPASEPPPRPRQPEARREPPAAGPAPRDAASPRVPQRQAHEGAQAPAAGSPPAAPNRSLNSRAARNPDAAEAARSGPRSDARARATARPEAGEARADTRTRDARARDAAHEAPGTPDASAAAGLAAVLAADPRTALAVGATAGTVDVAAAADALASAEATDTATARAAMPSATTPMATTPLAATVDPKATVAATADPTATVAATAGTTAARMVATPLAADASTTTDAPTVSAATVGPATVSSPDAWAGRATPGEAAGATGAAVDAAQLPLTDEAMGRLADTIARLGSEARARAARDPAEAGRVSVAASTTLPSGGEDTERSGRARTLGRAGREADARTDGRGAVDRRASPDTAATTPGTRRSDEPASASAAGTPVSTASALVRGDAAPRDAAVGAVAAGTPVDADGLALSGLAAPRLGSTTDATPAATGRAGTPASAAEPRAAAAPARTAPESSVQAPVAAGPSPVRDPRLDGTMPAVAAVAADAAQPAVITRTLSGPLAVAIGEPALRPLAARRTEAADDKPSAALPSPAAGPRPLDDLPVEVTRPRVREPEAPLAGLPASAELLARPAVAPAAVSAPLQPSADGTSAVLAAGAIEARAADAAAVAAPAADASAALATATIDAPVDSAAFAPALGARIALFARDGVEQARLNVHPAELGPISVQLSVDGSKVRVDMTADVGTTRQALEQSLPSLASSLRDAGFTLAGGGVFQQWGQGQREGTGSGPSSRLPGTADDAGDDGVSMTVSATPMRRTAGLVDVFA